jgi:CelD/BcsL family acetyltransferase involved in cellulose biosynthesis
MKNGPITGQVITPDALLKPDQEIWHRFLAHQPLAFLSYPYVRAVASCVPLVRICRVVREDRPVAFFPFQFRSAAHAAAGIGERLGGELSDYFGLITEPGFRIEAGALLRLSGLKSLFFTHLDESQRENGLVGEKPEVGYRIDFPQGGEAFWEERTRIDKKFTSDTERRERKLIREYGPARFVFSENDAEGSLNRLIADKRAQYHRTQVADVLSEKRTQDILHALCRIRDPQCSGIVSTLHAGDTWVASHFGLRCGSTLHYWFPVYNPALKAFAPGRILLKQIIHSAQAHGLERIDRGGGDSVAKRDFATSQHFFYSGLWQQPGPIALSHRVGLAIGWRLARYKTRGKAELE